MRRLILAAVLLFCARGSAQPGKCVVYDRALVAASHDGRYVLVSTTQVGGGPTDFELMDLARHRVTFDVTAWDLVEDETDLLQLGALKLQRVEETVEGSFSEVFARLEPTCKGRPGDWEQRRAVYFDVQESSFRYAVVRAKYVALVFDTGQTGDCDLTTGHVVFGVDCSAASLVEEKKDQQMLASGTPAAVRQRIASEVYRRKRDPLRALDLLSMLRQRLTSARIPRAVRLTMVADELLYASRLGWLGTQRCASPGLARTLAQYDLRKPAKPPPTEARLWKAIEANQRRCSKEPAG